jgi:hypothetical protein
LRCVEALKLKSAEDIGKVGKFGWSLLLIFCAAIAADQYLNYGYYTDGAVAMMRQIRNSFGW